MIDMNSLTDLFYFYFQGNNFLFNKYCVKYWKKTKKKIWKLSIFYQKEVSESECPKTKQER